MRLTIGILALVRHHLYTEIGPRPLFYQTRSAWSMDQGSNKKYSAVHNVAPTVTKFCVMWEVLSLPHDTKFGNCRDWLSCLVHPGVRDKRRVSEINLTQPRHETAFWWRHNGPVTSQLTDQIKWPNYPVNQDLCAHKHTQQRIPDTKMSQIDKCTNVLDIFVYIYGLSLNGWHDLFCITNNHHNVTIARHAIKRHFLIWMTPMRQSMERQCSCVLTLKYTFICVYWWTRQRIHNTLIVVDRYLRLMGDKPIPDSAEPHLESFYPPFFAGIDLPHQGVVDSYNR